MLFLISFISAMSEFRLFLKSISGFLTKDESFRSTASACLMNKSKLSQMLKSIPSWLCVLPLCSCSMALLMVMKLSLIFEFVRAIPWGVVNGVVGEKKEYISGDTIHDQDDRQEVLAKIYDFMKLFWVVN